MEFTFKGGVELRSNGFIGMKAIFDTLELKDILDQIRDKDIFDCLDKDAVAAHFGLVEPTQG